MKKTGYIEIRGAKAHNLKGVSLDIPRGEFVVVTGLSGSGKSSLAFDTIYAEGQRRYMDTLSTYAKHFMGVLEKPEVDEINGLSPIIAIEQKTTGNNPRSTVGTITEIFDFLRLQGVLAGDGEGNGALYGRADCQSDNAQLQWQEMLPSGAAGPGQEGTLQGAVRPIA